MRSRILPIRVSGWGRLVEDISWGKEVKALRGQVVEWTIYMIVEVTENDERSSDRNRPQAKEPSAKSFNELYDWKDQGMTARRKSR